MAQILEDASQILEEVGLWQCFSSPKAVGSTNGGVATTRNPTWMD
jgi:hypothetical protein